MANKEEQAKLDAKYEEGRQQRKNDGIVAGLIHDVADALDFGEKSPEVKAQEEGYHGQPPSHHQK